MFKNHNLVPIAGIASTIAKGVRVAPMSALENAIYRELTLDEKPDIESLLDFYQKDAHHEHLMDTISTDLARGVTGVINKVQNELLDLVDTTFEEVTRATRDLSNEIVTHKLTTIPEVEFISTDYSQEIDAINVSGMTRMAYNRASGSKFPSRTSAELLQRIRTTMSDDTFYKFASMVTTLNIDIVAIYDTVIRSYETKLTPLTPITPMKIGYSYIEAIVGYHIAKSLMVTQDEDTRLSEAMYGEYVSILVNNLTVRYGNATNMLHASLKVSSEKARYTVEGGIIHLSVYKPTIDGIMESKEIGYGEAIKSILSECVVNEFGIMAGTDRSERYEIYRRDRMIKNSLNTSSAKIKQTLVSLEKFVNSRHFNTWFESNGGVEPKASDRILVMKRCRDIVGPSTVTTDDELYSLIITTVCEAFYNRPGIRRFVGDIRTCMASYDIDVHEAIGLASDRLIMSYLVEMVEV